METSEDLGNVIVLEHINVENPNQGIVSDFYLETLQFTRDPFMRPGTSNIWINVGYQQVHSPTGPVAQVFNGITKYIVPDLNSLQQTLQAAVSHKKLENTLFSWRHVNIKDNNQYHIPGSKEFVEVTCPWGNTYHFYTPNPEFSFRGNLGIAAIEFVCRHNSAKQIGQFYKEFLGAPYEDCIINGHAAVKVKVGVKQVFVFRESENNDIKQWQKTHLCIYIANFSETFLKFHHHKLVYLNPTASDQISELPDALKGHMFRFKDVVHPETKELLFECEHEIRSLCHHQFMRPLVNRTGSAGFAPSC